MPDESLRNRYFVTQANVKKTTKLAPSATQTHSGMTFPQFPSSRFP
jgi:hypothetical protein